MQDKSRQNENQAFIKYPENISIEDLRAISIVNKIFLNQMEMDEMFRRRTKIVPENMEANND
ncbi:hypothetical protein [Peptoniphilus porci]|uniref:Uncharacterized protein n=1 Tax=Peptoniphilus porci TaxID=2652280 RepID=A0A1U7LXB3_9FIRM|nr:hypothetical protein [Peptoniphilus porci]OLR61683.1 hypothetical protein BIV18_10035 [Peptoniphilus porci]